MTESPDAQSFAKDGYVVVPHVVTSQEIDSISGAMEGALGNKAGTRKLLDLEWCLRLADQLAGHQRLSPFVPADVRAVQCTLFVKTIGNNWLVSFHQDLSIPVSERVESARCSGWSQKQGDTFCQPPVCVLEKLVAMRLHLDDCHEGNGALRVVPGSHRLGRLTAEAAIREREYHGEGVVSVPKGGVMIMRPLLLHASSKNADASLRRVLHFVYGPPVLPEGLRWPGRKRSSLSVN
jgi:ectoine hydroxylase-related dioxygenase (phytanoyl-CoA dioxygenase family)